MQSIALPESIGIYNSSRELISANNKHSTICQTLGLRYFARFLNKVRRIRNDIAHNGTVYNINQGFSNKLSACVKVCKEFEKLPYGKTLCLS